jgi:putative oxidoreductase
MEFIRDIFSLLGRVCISSMFLWACYEKIKHWGTTVAYMKEKNVPKLNLVLPISVGIKILGGLMILLGWRPHSGALMLLVVTIASALYLHPFWKERNTADRALEKALFMKELAIIGGLFLILALGSGHFGLSSGG